MTEDVSIPELSRSLRDYRDDTRQSIHGVRNDMASFMAKFELALNEVVSEMSRGYVSLAVWEEVRNNQAKRTEEIRFNQGERIGAVEQRMTKLEESVDRRSDLSNQKIEATSAVLSQKIETVADMTVQKIETMTAILIQKIETLDAEIEHEFEERDKATKAARQLAWSTFIAPILVALVLAWVSLS